jgi:hypothetical protein
MFKVLEQWAAVELGHNDGSTGLFFVTFSPVVTMVDLAVTTFSLFGRLTRNAGSATWPKDG